MASCFEVVYMIYYSSRGDPMESFLAWLSETSGNIVSIIALVGLCSVGFVNIYGYCQAKTFDIPFRITFTNIRDCIEAFVVFLATIGLGIVAPYSLARITHIDFNQSNVIVFLPLFISGVVAFNIVPKAKKGYTKKVKIIRIVFKSLIVIFGFGALFFYALNTGWMGFLAYVYSIFMGICFLFYATTKMFFAKDLLRSAYSAMTCEVKNTRYIITVRYSAKEWILIPYELSNNILYYKKGEFIVSNLEELVIFNKDYKNILPMEHKPETASKK